MAAMEEEAQPPSRFRPPHIKKRALKNKALSVSFSEKDLTYLFSSAFRAFSCVC